MSTLLSPQARRLLAAPFDPKCSAQHLGRALWLYLYVVLGANSRGLFLRQATELAEALQVTEADLECWLTRLSEAGLIGVLSPPPFLVLKLSLWSDSTRSKATISPAASTKSSNLHIEVPVSSSAAAAAASNTREDGGQGEGEALLREVLATLGEEAIPEELRDLLPRYSVAVIRQALRRVETTPLSQIRKSKTALFRYLLDKLS